MSRPGNKGPSMITIIMCILIVLLVIVFYDPTPAFRR